MQFLKTDDTLFPEEARIEHGRAIIHNSLFDLRDQIMNDLSDEFAGRWGEPKQRQVKERAKRLLREHHARVAASNLLPGCTLTIRREIKTQVQNAIDWWKNEFKRIFGLANTDLRLIEELALDLLLREEPSDVETGFVIAGFGEQEAFAQLRSFEFESSIRDVHKIRNGDPIDSREGAVIVPFAQVEMIETFVEGRARRLNGFLLRLIDRYFQQEKQKAAQNPQMRADLAATHAFLDNMNNDLRAQFQDGLHQFTEEYHVQPILETVSALPKEELAVMAEALINLTAIKRRMSPDAETVGGPIDVAVISKGDGLIWIKRKHYFQPELNPGFGHNYFQEGAKP